jgi:hypothetical protein
MTVAQAVAPAGHVPRSRAVVVPAALVVVITAYYAVLGLAVLRPQAVYAGDIGVKYVQAQALVSNRFRSLHIPYEGEFLDPQGRFNPLRPPFVMFVGGTTQAIFPPASTVLQAAAVAVAGFRGMVLLTVLAAGLILYSALRLSPARDATAVVFVLGLASPLWFYAISGWEHAPGVALGTLGFALVWGAGGRSFPLLAGLAVGAGATIRDEVILLVPGLVLAVWLKERRVRPVAASLAGVVVPLALAMALEVWWFERPAAAHMRHAVHVLQSALSATDEPNPDVPVLRRMTDREKYEAVVQYWILGYGDDRWIATFTGAGAAAVLIRAATGSAIPLLVWLGGIIGLALIDWHELMTAPKWLAGLLRVAPYLVFVLFPRPRGSSDDRTLQVVALATAGAYLGLAFVGADTHGGKSLGPRLLLPLLPLLAVPAVMQIRAYAQRGAGVERWVGYGGVLLVVMSLMMHVLGTTRAYVVRNRDDSSAIVALARSPAGVVVADDMFTAQLLLPLYKRKVILLADSPGLQAELGRLLADQRVPEAVLVTRRPGADLSLPPLRLDREEQLGRMLLKYFRR